MKEFLTRFLLIACSPFLLQQLPAQKVSFASHPPGPGTEITLTSSLRSDMTLTIAMEGAEKEMPMSNRLRETKRIRILAADDAVWSSAVVVYDRYEETDSRAGGAKPGPVVGRAYRIDRGDSVRVRAEDSTLAISESERAFLAAEYRKRDMETKFSRLFRGRTMSVGDSLLLEKELAAPIFSDMKGANDVRAFTLRFREIRRAQETDCAVFGLSILLAGGSGPLDMRLTLDGTLLVGIADGRVYGLDLSGPVEAHSTNAELPMSGRGTFTASRSARYASR